ncbi:MAG: hydroxymethylbilane synthase [Actinomycetota bacterium]|nr:hydroxymethylbilane synthase [Actinomycetota bacterium]
MTTVTAGGNPLRLGTRRSALALTQSRAVAAAISAQTGRQVQLVEITTHGDISRENLTVIGGTGVFVSALREALLADRVDVAVHSLKDLPTGDPERLRLAAVPAREDPRDALVARDGLRLAELPAGARVGTGAPRRAAQLRALGYDLEVLPIRGNVDTRLRYVVEGKLDAIVLARAGLARLGRLDAVTEVLDPLQMLPAPGQGALAVECRSDDEATRALLAGLDDEATRAAVTAERTLLRTLEAGCSAPVGAYADVVEGEQEPELYLRGVVASIDGSASVRLSTTGPTNEASAVGHRLAVEMLAEGAGDLMGERVP